MKKVLLLIDNALAARRRDLEKVGRNGQERLLVSESIRTIDRLRAELMGLDDAD